MSEARQMQSEGRLVGVDLADAVKAKLRVEGPNVMPASKAAKRHAEIEAAREMAECRGARVTSA